jgi:hypothetical protein
LVRLASFLPRLIPLAVFVLGSGRAALGGRSRGPSERDIVGAHPYRSADHRFAGDSFRMHRDIKPLLLGVAARRPKSDRAASCSRIPSLSLIPLRDSSIVSSSRLGMSGIGATEGVGASKPTRLRRSMTFGSGVWPCPG